MSRWSTCFSLFLLVSACGAPAPAPTERDEATASDDDDLLDESDDQLESRDRCKPKLPKGGLLATFRVVDETFHSLITNPTGIQQAIDLWQGRSTATIPVGRLECKRRRYNCPYHWHQVPSSIEFADFAIEVCDGLPSFVEDDCPNFGAGQYCPFAAELTLLQDCRKSRRCPVVPRR
jgi:hypothetical protein